VSGKKGQSGGARPGSGPHRRRLHLDKVTAHSLSILTKQRQELNPLVTEEQIVSELIQAAWQELDQEYQEAGDRAREGERE